MGFLFHGRTQYEFDDRTLAHLKIAIAQKLRNQESFFLNWSIPTEEGSGRMSIWLSPSSELAFHFQAARAPELNVVWVKVLASLAYSPRGLVVMSEAEAEQYAAKNPDLL
ncbi:hypothetical protein ACFWHR_04895 [Leucobacter sp. NPDC058333]|uniref:DUF7882 family protein n=1 Tax=Leucobacter sp. NPDC058333 TaxID=3346450 RepID=UPI00364E13F7